MNPKLEKFLYLAEEQYLPTTQLEDYQSFLGQLGEKIKVYEILREQEVFLFKILADELQERYPDERSQILGEVLAQWSLALKYCGMAMILDNPDYLASRVDNWLKELIELRQIPAMDELVYSTLVEILPEVLLDDQVALIQPYVEQIKTLTVLGTQSEQLLEVA